MSEMPEELEGTIDSFMVEIMLRISGETPSQKVYILEQVEDYFHLRFRKIYFPLDAGFCKQDLMMEKEFNRLGAKKFRRKLKKYIKEIDIKIKQIVRSARGSTLMDIKRLPLKYGENDFARPRREPPP